MSSTTPPVDQPATTRTIDQICLSPFNVRTDARATSPEAIAIMEKLLLSQGQLEPILVHPLKGNTKKWGAHAGGRRYRAFVNLIGRGDLPRDYPIKVEIKEGRTDAELIEESMVENIGRRDLEPYETFAGVRRAHALGHSVDRIAEGLGQERTVIARMLRLGNLAKPIFDALAAGKISTEQARAFGSTEDTAVQLGAWQRLSAGLASFTVPAERIRAAIGIGDQELGKLLTFVGEEAYVAAGGRLEPDLFATRPEDPGRIVDAAKLVELTEAMIDVLRADTRRHTGRPDLRFVTRPPEAMGTTDYQLQIHARPGEGGKIPLPDGDVVARIYVDANGKAVTDYWWASRSAKYARERGERATAASSPAAADVAAKAEGLRPAAAIGQQYDGARQIADAALRQEDGLSAESVQVFRSLRRAILRGMLVNDARAGSAVGLDYLVWTQLRLAMDMDARPSKLGIAGKTGAESDPEYAREHVRAMPAHADWCEALEDLRVQSFVTSEDLSDAFADYRASEARLKNVVAGWSLERSLAADGYVVPVHDELARQMGVAAYNHDKRIRGYWTPTEGLLARIPTRQALAIAEPFVEPEPFGAWAKARAAEVVRRLTQLVTGEQVRGARADRAATAAAWVHPLLRFLPAPPEPKAHQAAAAEQLEAAE
jgi:ParB family chromosome partitioning protein